MKNRLLVFLVPFLFLLAHRLPAPIQEEETTSTPVPAASAPEQVVKPKRKSSAKSTSTEQPSSKSEAKPKSAPPLEGPARFAGTWTGKINQGLLGHVQSSLTVDGNASSIELSQNLGGGSKHLKTNGNTISWKTGVMGEITWTLSPDSDGQTAQVTMKGLMLHDTATFRRGQAAAAPATASQPSAKSTSTAESSVAGGSITGPRPIYNQSMRDAHLSGTGTYLLHFDTSTGNVSEVTVSQSSGSGILDQAAIEAFRQWHEQPNGKKEFPITISFP